MYNITTPLIFKSNKVNKHALYKKSKTRKDKITTAFNTPVNRHFPPYITEWVNSIYCYNNNNLKILPNSCIEAYNLINSYFHLYITKKHNKRYIKMRSSRVRKKRNNLKKLTTSKPSVKHTNDKISIIVYTYDKNNINYKIKTSNMFKDRQNKQYIAFIKDSKKELISLENELKNKLNNKLENGALDKFYTQNIKNCNKTLEYMFLLRTFFNKIVKKKNLLSSNINFQVFTDKNLNNFIKKVMQNEMLTIIHKQHTCFEQNKYEKQHIEILTTLLENIYKKKVVLDIVNLKYFYNSNSIFSEIVLNKLRTKGKKNKTNSILHSALSTFQILTTNQLKSYNEVYKKTFIDNVDQIMDSLKNKFVNGMKISTVGKSLNNVVSARSASTYIHKGNTRDLDSSDKGLRTVLLRGYAKSNLVYVKSGFSTRLGAFGVKTWVSNH